MLPNRFWFFSKKCVYKGKCGADTEAKSCVKNIIVNEISLEHLSNKYCTTVFLEL